MYSTFRDLGRTLLVWLPLVVLACSNDPGDPGGTGASAGVAGSSNTGGIVGSGGTPGSEPTGGGMPAAGGDGSTAGSGAVGGTAAAGSGAGRGPSAGREGMTGGAAPSGGAAGAGGNAATGGRASSGGATGTEAGGEGGSSASGGAAASGGFAATGGEPQGGAGGTRAGAGGAAAGGSGGGGYRACPASPCKIMPLGDSITWGVGDEGNGGYRGPLFASVVAAGQKVTFTGSLSNGPSSVSGQTFPKSNEGHSGWGISEVTPYSNNNAGIATVIPNPGFSSGSGGVPDIILLHIGTNDQGSFAASKLTSDLAGLLDKISMNAPNAYVVVAQIIPLGYGDNGVIKTYNQSIPELVEERASAGKHITMVDMFTGFTPGTMLASDSIHPNSTGYKFMADHWYAVIGSLLPE